MPAPDPAASFLRMIPTPGSTVPVELQEVAPEVNIFTISTPTCGWFLYVVISCLDVIMNGVKYDGLLIRQDMY